MIKSKPRGWNIMPSYNSFPLPIYKSVDNQLEEVAKFQIKSKPLGIRGLRGLSWLLHLTPHVTGGKPKFRFQVVRVYQKQGDYFIIALSRMAYGKETVLSYESKICKDSYVEDFEDSHITEPSMFTYNILVQTHFESAKATVVSFKALAQEDMVIAISSFVLVLLVAGLSSFLTWLLVR